MAEAVGDRGLEVGRRGEGDELVRLGQHSQDFGRGADEADLPAGQRENLAGRADLDRALAHALHRHQRQMADAVEHDVLPDLVADGDRVVVDAGAGEHLERLAAVDDGGRIERIVEQNDARAVGEGGGEIGLVEGPKRRLQRDELRHAAGALNQRQIGVVHRLEQHDLVARLDQRQQRAGDRLGRARGHHHFAFGIEFEPLVALIVRGDRRAQLRQAEHRRILVPAVNHRLGRLGAYVGGPGIVGEALAEIDRLALARQARHDFEDADAEPGEKGVHDQPLVTVRAFSAQRPASGIARTSRLAAFDGRGRLVGRAARRHPHRHVPGVAQSGDDQRNDGGRGEPIGVGGTLVELDDRGSEQQKVAQQRNQRVEQAVLPRGANGEATDDEGENPAANRRRRSARRGRARRRGCARCGPA